MRKFARAAVLLLLTAVLVAGAFALSACDKGGGKNGGVFNEEMGFGDVLRILQNMDSWTESISGSYRLNSGRFDGAITTRVDGLDYIMKVEAAGSTVPATVYSFRHLNYYYEVTEVNDGEPSYSNLTKYSAGSRLNIDYEMIYVFSEDENPTAYKYNGEYYPSVSGATGFVLRVLRDDANGVLKKSYQEDEDGITLNAKLYFKDNGLCMDIYMSNSMTGESMDLTVKITDVDATEVVIPDEVQKLKSLC